MRIAIRRGLTSGRAVVREQAPVTVDVLRAGIDDLDASALPKDDAWLGGANAGATYVRNQVTPLVQTIGAGVPDDAHRSVLKLWMRLSVDEIAARRP